ncbi:hypothetical protein GCM10017557_72710 [Streptomyces aurantiacus]|uniref:Uncharacterized protein n=1 Tax=Streptomyces aurantiacus TaxID=47760 RepID=A0A7G1PBJ7_9ACTN|nr:hypothetical protein GCM10017557_72710 [Streptomyces aurantiacus]
METATATEVGTPKAVMAKEPATAMPLNRCVRVAGRPRVPGERGCVTSGEDAESRCMGSPVVEQQVPR